MMTAPLPENENARLNALNELQLLDTAAEPEYDDLARLAARICQTPIALISLVDEDRQWLKAKVGVEASQTPRNVAFCSHAILKNEMLVVPDALEDERFADSPLVASDPHVRFYAGMPLAAEPGVNVGTLCVIDFVPRRLSAEQQEALGALSRQVMLQFQLRRHAQELARAAAERQRVEKESHAAEARFRAFMDHSPTAAFMKDEEGRFVYYNRLMEAKFSISADAWLGKRDHEVWPAEIASQLREHDLRVLAGDQAIAFSETTRVASGDEQYWQSFKFPFTDGAGRRLLAGMALDVTEEKRAADALRESENRYRDLLDNMEEMVFSVGTEGDFVYANRAWRRKLGYEATNPPFNVFCIVHPEDQGRFRTLFERLQTGGKLENTETRFVTKTGDVLFVEGTAQFRFEQDRPVSSRFIFRDVTDRKQKDGQLQSYQRMLEESNVRLTQLALTDGLTGLQNRRAFRERLDKEVERADRYWSPISLLLLDVDHFKQFNDAFGHPAGDEVLKQVSRLLMEKARTNDFVARYGGEEFVVILPNTDETGATAVAERFRDAIADAAWDKRAITVSIGVSTLAVTRDDASILISAADEALYLSKRNGRNCVHHASHLRSKVKV